MATETQSPSDLIGSRLSRWAQRVGLARKLGILLSVGVIISGAGTLAALTGAPPFGPDPRSVLVLLLIDLILLLSVGTLILRRLVMLWMARRRGAAGSRLHARLVVAFSILAVAPAIFVAVFSALFFNLGIQAWFSDKVKTALDESVLVAEAYVDEHRKLIIADVRAMATDISRQSQLFLRDPAQFNQLVEFQAGVRSIPEAIVFDSSGRILGRSQLSFSLEFDGLPVDIIREAASGDILVLEGSGEGRVRALTRLEGFADAYLYVGRFVDANVLAHVQRNRDASDAYYQLEGRRTEIEITFAMIFIVVALMLLLVAVWAGLVLANRLVRPLSGLVTAAERIRAGDLGVRVEEQDSKDEVAMLSRAFNRMTSQLEGQRTELVEANQQLDQRRRFTEAILSGVTAGVIGLNPEGLINLPNRSALDLLDTDSESLVGEDLAIAVPEMADILEKAAARPDRLLEDEITVSRGGRERQFLVRIAAEGSFSEMRGFVVTFDDVTELAAAQRRAAWADIARRIAHEIKNPLTPIQLAAERLRRKYQDEVKTDPDVFADCTDTIIRQVGEIDRLISEFSNFARMPAPEFRSEDITELARRALFMQQVGSKSITYNNELPDSAHFIRCDAGQVGQALTNILQNAAQAFEDWNNRRPPTIWISAIETDQGLEVAITDNGPGLPAEIRDKLIEPYVTTRDAGTGLGLSIVAKILEDHGGYLHLDNNPGGGTKVRMVFPTSADDDVDDSSTDKNQDGEATVVTHGA
jgi:two-component system nitrogen regulation sensor histidine kinase NtrY